MYVWISEPGEAAGRLWRIIVKLGNGSKSQSGRFHLNIRENFLRMETFQ